MNSVRRKNAVGIALIVIIACAIIAGAVVAGINANRTEEEREFFIDTAPLDYGAAESVVYVKRFRDAVTKYLQSVSAEFDLTVLADRLLDSLSAARVPAVKLGGMAAAINKYSVDGMLGALNGGELTEEQLREIFEKTSFDYVSGFLDSFFEESGLTGEEFGLFLYSYLNKYGSAEYRTALNALGKDNFVELLSSTTYFITSVGDAGRGESRFLDEFVLQAAFYQLGTVFTRAADTAGAVTLEKALGLYWRFGTGKENYGEINSCLSALDGNFSYLLTLFGCILKETGHETIAACVEYASDDGAGLIYSRCLAASAVKRGVDRFLSEYGVEFGAESFAELAARFRSVAESLYKAQLLTAGGDTESAEFKALLSESAARITEFVTAVEFLSDKSYTMEDIASLGAEEFERAAREAKAVAAIEQNADYFASSVIYMWASVRLHEIKGGTQ